MSIARMSSCLVAALFVVSACLSQDGDANSSQLSVRWTADVPSWESGVTVESLPSQFEFVTNQGNEVAIQHFFADSLRQELEVFRSLQPETYPTEIGVIEVSNGVTFMEGANGDSRQVFFDTQGVRMGVASPDLSLQQLLLIAKSMSYDPASDLVAIELANAQPSVTPDGPSWGFEAVS